MSFADEPEDGSEPVQFRRMKGNLIPLKDAEDSSDLSAATKSSSAQQASRPAFSSGGYSAESLAALRKQNQDMSLRKPLPSAMEEEALEEGLDEPFGKAAAVGAVIEPEAGTEELDLPDELDEDSIQKIKEYRERRRAVAASKEADGDDLDPASEAAGDFIPLSEKRTGSSRPPNLRKLGRSNLRNQLLKEEEAEDEEGKGDVDQWEVEMIKRGGTLNSKFTERLAGVTASTTGRGIRSTEQRKRRTMEEIEAALEKTVDEISEEHERNLRTLSKLKMDIKTTEAELTDLRTEVTGISEHFEFFQETRDYVNDLCSCLRAKLPMIDEVEDAILRLLNEHTESLFDRTRQDILDRLEAAEKKGIKLRYPHAQNWKSVDASLSSSDFAGRDKSYYLETMREKRRQDRIRRYEERSVRRGSSKTEDGIDKACFDEGMESDALPAETCSTLRTRMDRLEEAAALIFEDVVEEFSKLEFVASRFEQWKAKFPKAYKDAYCSLSLPSILAPYVRVEMLSWQPFLPTNVSPKEMPSSDCFGEFDRFRWFQTLFSYGQAAQSSAAEADEDSNLVPKIFQTVVIEIFVKHLLKVWNPFSLKQSRQGVEIFEELVEVFQVSAEYVDKILEAIFRRIQQTSKLLCVPVVDLTDKEAEDFLQGIEEERAFCSQQFAQCLKHQRSVAAWIAVVPDGHSKWTSLLAAHLVKTMSEQQVPYLSYLTALHEIESQEEEKRKILMHFLVCAEDVLKLVPEQGKETKPYHDIQKALSRFADVLKNHPESHAVAAKIEKMLASLGS